MKLYTYYQSSAAYRVRIALGLKGLRAEMAFIDLTKAEHKNADYRRLNPQGAVPVFIDKGHMLNQSLAIMEYLEECYPQPPLLPQDAFARAHVRSLSLAVAGDMHPLGNLQVRKYLAEEMGQSKEVVGEWMRHWMASGFEAFEASLAASSHMGAFCHGDSPTMADCCLIPQLFNARRWQCDLTPYPCIRKVAQACESHPAFIAAHPHAQPDAPKPA